MKTRYLQTIVLIIFAVVLIAVGWYLFVRKDGSTLLTYTNQTYGVSFSYPDNYKLTESSSTEGEPRTLVTLIEKGINLPKDGEGPTAITVNMFDAGTTTSNTLLSWVRTSPYSNFNLSGTTTPGSTTVGDEPALLYTWDGLYQGTSLAVLHDSNIILFSVTYDGETDLKKRADFTDLIASVRWSDVTTGTSTAQ